MFARALPLGRSIGGRGGEWLRDVGGGGGRAT